MCCRQQNQQFIRVASLFGTPPCRGVQLETRRGESVALFTWPQAAINVYQMCNAQSSRGSGAGQQTNQVIYISCTFCPARREEVVQGEGEKNMKTEKRWLCPHIFISSRSWGWCWAWSGSQCEVESWQTFSISKLKIFLNEMKFITAMLREHGAYN